MKNSATLILISLFTMITSGFAQQKELGTIKIMSYNIHHANPPSKPNQIDLDAVASVIAAQNPDFVALQEVDVNTKRSGNVNQAQQLAAKLKMYYFFAKAIDYSGGDYGVAILSKYKLIDSVAYPLKSKPTGNPEARVLAVVQVKLANKQRISFACTHLDAEGDSLSRMLQIEQINNIVKKEKGPFFIAGDFNAKLNSSVIKELEKTFTKSCSTCDFTFPYNKPKITIDYIAFKKNKRIAVSSHQVLPDNYASDHLPIMATFSIRP
ncbi:MAG: endonuclease/exonuclease/phosphatase family protein [Bacteroidota bacterium]